MKQRLLSLDVLRGITVFGMIVVNNAGGKYSYDSLQHSVWNGLTPCDLVLPFYHGYIHLYRLTQVPVPALGGSYPENSAPHCAYLSHRLGYLLVRVRLRGRLLSLCPYPHLGCIATHCPLLRHCLAARPLCAPQRVGMDSGIPALGLCLPITFRQRICTRCRGEHPRHLGHECIRLRTSLP